ncbi:MAG: aromatic ring-opening dioxygenase subunit LigB [Thermomicrobiales bacterium]
MAGIVLGAVMPHGWTLIPELSPDAEGATATVQAMHRIEALFTESRPDLIVLATPHNVRVEGEICLPRVGRGAGSILYKGRTVEMNVPMDVPFTEALAERARARGLPIALAGFAGNNPNQSVIPLDWGAMVPLWFLGHGRNRPGLGDVLAETPADDFGPLVVLVSPSRALDRLVNVAFGEVVAEVAANAGRRVAFIASCDWSHAHRGSRYGENIAAAEALDAEVVGALQAGDPGRLIDLDEELVSSAAIDGLWQALMLAGVLNKAPMDVTFLSYEVAESFSTGLAVAAFTPRSA